jgi:hypothetical protein
MVQVSGAVYYYDQKAEDPAAQVKAVVEKLTPIKYFQFRGGFRSAQNPDASMLLYQDFLKASGVDIEVILSRLRFLPRRLPPLPSPICFHTSGLSFPRSGGHPAPSSTRTGTSGVRGGGKFTPMGTSKDFYSTIQPISLGYEQGENVVGGHLPGW